VEREYLLFTCYKCYGISINFLGILLKVSTTIQTRYKKGSRRIKGLQYIKKQTQNFLYRPGQAPRFA
jgi:hypothetical protein